MAYRGRPVRNYQGVFASRFPPMDRSTGSLHQSFGLAVSGEQRLRCLLNPSHKANARVPILCAHDLNAGAGAIINVSFGPFRQVDSALDVGGGPSEYDNNVYALTEIEAVKGHPLLTVRHLTEEYLTAVVTQQCPRDLGAFNDLFTPEEGAKRLPCLPEPVIGDAATAVKTYEGAKWITAHPQVAEALAPLRNTPALTVVRMMEEMSTHDPALLGNDHFTGVLRWAMSLCFEGGTTGSRSPVALSVAPEEIVLRGGAAVDLLTAVELHLPGWRVEGEEGRDR